MNFNFLKSNPVDYVNIVYFKNKGKLSSFTLSYRLFSFLRNLVILGVIWIPISVYIISVQLGKRVMSARELTKNRDIILAYQDRIDSLYSKTYSDTSVKLLDDKSSKTDSTTVVASSTTQTTTNSSSDSTNSNSTEPTSSEVNSSEQLNQSASDSLPSQEVSTSFPVDIKDLSYSYSDNTLDVSFNLASVIPPKSHKGRLLIVASIDNEDSTIIYPQNSIGSKNISAKSGESFKVASFKTVTAKYNSQEGKKITSFKIICYSNESSSPMEREIIL